MRMDRGEMDYAAKSGLRSLCNHFIFPWNWDAVGIHCNFCKSKLFSFKNEQAINISETPFKAKGVTVWSLWFVFRKQVQETFHWKR